MRRKRPALFRGRHFADEIIVLCVRWYLPYSLSYRDRTEIMCERNLSIDPSTIWRWVQRYAPELIITYLMAFSLFGKTPVSLSARFQFEGGEKGGGPVEMY